MKSSRLVRAFIAATSVLLSICPESRGAVANDRFSNAQVISGSSGSVTGSNTSANKEQGEPDHAGNPGGSSIWYRWTAPATGPYSFNTFGSSFDTLLAVYTGSSVGSLAVVATNDDYGAELVSEVTVPAIAGTTYQIAVDGYDNETGTVALNWAPEVPPSNDSFANATLISGPSGSVNGNNSGASIEAGEPNHSGEGGRSVWFRWTAPFTGEYSFSTAGSAIDTLLGVYTGVSVNALAVVATNDDFEIVFTSQVTFWATNGTTYFIAIDGYRRSAGALTLTWAVVPPEPEPPVIQFRVLHTFAGGTDARGPHADLILSGNTLYGTTVSGGSSGNGTVFKINTDGSGYAILHHCTVARGVNPFSPLILSNSTLYGTTRGGGTFGWGTVFALNTNGTGFTNLYHFPTAVGNPPTNSNGALPSGGLVLSPSGNTLYGTTLNGGPAAKGTIFAVNIDGTGFTNLYNFSAQEPSGENSDGAMPWCSLVLSGNTLYGTALNGGSQGFGTVFAIRTNGTLFSVLHHFQSSSNTAHAHSLVLSGNTLYGTGNDGSVTGSGAVFAIRTDGTGYTNLMRFPAVLGDTYTNSHGANPFPGLSLNADTLYGATLGGGYGGKGTVFSLNTNGSGFTSVYHFPAGSGIAATNSDGAYPRGGVVSSGNSVYGTAERGGAFGYGTVFSISMLPPRPRLTITASKPNVILSWPTNTALFTLEGTTNLSLTNSWSPVPQPPITNSGQISVTVPTTERTRAFRLHSP
jgi:uncharacterized repeat protein (TIGR03803 family)